MGTNPTKAAFFSMSGKDSTGFSYTEIYDLSSWLWIFTMFDVTHQQEYKNHWPAAIFLKNFFKARHGLKMGSLSLNVALSASGWITSTKNLEWLVYLASPEAKSVEQIHFHFDDDSFAKEKYWKCWNNKIQVLLFIFNFGW